jgi:hypothetical protein
MVRIKQSKHTPESIEGALVFKTPSNSRAGMFHYTIVARQREGGFFEMCSCEGARYHKRCYHLDYAIEVLEGDIVQDESTLLRDVLIDEALNPDG